MPTAHVSPTHPVLHVNDHVVVLGDGEDVDAVTLQIGSEVSHRCGRCGEELTETVEGVTSDDSGPSCPDYQPDDAVSPVTDGRHVPVGVPLSWCNSAGVSLDGDADAVTVSVSVGDPRGAFVFTVRRVPDDAEGRFTGRLILHVPDPDDSSPHMRLTAIRPGTFLIGDPAGQASGPGNHTA